GFDLQGVLPDQTMQEVDPEQLQDGAPAGPDRIRIARALKAVVRLDLDEDGLLFNEGLDRVGAWALHREVAQVRLGSGDLHCILLIPSIRHRAGASHYPPARKRAARPLA